MKLPGTSQLLLSVAKATSLETVEFRRNADGLVTSGDIAITMFCGASVIFTWPDAVAYGLMVDSSLGGHEPVLWEIDSAVGFSSVVAFGQCPQFAREVASPLPLIRGRRYFVSVYGGYPSYGIQEFVY